MSNLSLLGLDQCVPTSTAENEGAWRPGRAYREAWQSTITTTDAIVVIVRAAGSHEGLRLKQVLTAALQREGKVILDE